MNLEELKNKKLNGEKKLYDVSFLFYDVKFPVQLHENPRDDETFKKLLKLIDEGELLKVYKYIDTNEIKMNPVDLHFLYTTLQEAYYKKRDEDYTNIDKSKVICERDIVLLECDLINLELAYVPCLNRLINIFENNCEFDKAIELCKFGTQRLYESNMVDGFIGRIQSLKLRKQKYESTRTN